jgi:hypothetical protein
MPSLPVEMIGLLAPLCATRFRAGRLHAQVLVLGAILAPGKRTVSSCLRVMGLAWERHFTNYHRVVNRAQWSALQASKILLGMLSEYASSVSYRRAHSAYGTHDTAGSRLRRICQVSRQI